MSLFQTSLPIQDGIYRALQTMPPLPIAQRSNLWPLTAYVYEPLWRRHSLSILTQGQLSVKEELDLMLEWIGPQPHQTILDAACSAGLYARTLSKQPNLDLHALDLSLPFLQQAKSYAAKDAIFITLVQADVSQLPYIDQSFDHIVCGGSLNEFLNITKTLSEFSRALKPKGQLWLMYLSEASTPLSKTIQTLFKTLGIRFIYPEVLEALAKDMKLALIKSQQHGIVTMQLFEKC